MYFDVCKLRAELALIGLKEYQFAKEIGLHRVTLSKRMHGISEWQLNEVYKCFKIFGEEKTIGIFFARKVS